MTTLRASIAVFALVVASATPALAQQSSPAGRIKTVSGAAFILRDKTEIAARPGQVVFEADSLRTGADGSIGVTLKTPAWHSGPRAKFASSVLPTRRGASVLEWCSASCAA